MGAQGRERFTVFLDAEGTLYVPRAGRNSEDFWERGEPTLPRAVETFRLDPDASEVLLALRREGTQVVVASRHQPDLLRSMLIHFGIWHFFEDVLVGNDKAGMVTAYLDERDLPRREALMVGDTPLMDVHPFLDAGIDAVLLERAPGTDRDGLERIDGLKGLLPLVRKRRGPSEGDLGHGDRV